MRPLPQLVGKFIPLTNVPIWEQLRLEEALFRADRGNYCLVNYGSSPAIVMGLSAKVDDVLHLDRVDIPVWRRFSGGGTVVVDEETVFVTFIGNSADFGVEPYPHDLFRWTANFYEKVFDSHPFKLRENDYVLDDRKMGGNAQAFARGRFVHHTSFLWDFNRERMGLLKMPPKMPTYREKREHDQFLTTLKDRFNSKTDFSNRVLERWKGLFGEGEGTWDGCLPFFEREYRKALTKLEGS